MDKWVESQCSCSKCVKMCESKPCFGIPEEIDKIIDAGLGENLRAYYSTNGQGESLTSIQPACVGFPETNPSWPDGPCKFLANGLCRLHDLGLKPFEGRMAIHDKPDNTIRQHVIPLWNTELGKSVVDKWKKKFEPN